jgi:hypothetical protein
MACCCSVFMYSNPKIETFETWKCPVYIIELPSRKHFSASFVVEPEHQQIFRVATNTSHTKCGKWPILIKWTWLLFTYNGLDQSWYRLVCSISSNNEPLGDRDDSQRPPREMEWMERNMWGFLKNQGNTKETMSSSKQSITNI